MKNKVIAYLSVISFFLSCKSTKSPILKVHSTVYDFTEIGKKDSVQGIFIIENAGSGTLLVKNIAPSCNCTIVSFEKKPILPGETRALKFVYKPVLAYDEGKVEKEIVLQTNTEKQLYVLKIRGSVL